MGTEAVRKPTRLQKMVQNTVFETVFLCVIISNAIFVGYQTDLASKGSDDQAEPVSQMKQGKL